MREETAALPNAGMQIAPDQGQFMALLVKLIGAAKVLEVGVFTGYSSLSLALALPEQGRITAFDSDTAAVRALNLKIHADTRVDISLLPVADGLTLALKCPAVS